MFVDEIIELNHCVSSRELILLKEHCSQFLQEARTCPLYKPLPIDYNDFQKVKVRQRKQDGVLQTALTQAFEHEYSKLASRAVFAYAHPIEGEVLQETFYIFPINGYKYIYSKQVKNSAIDYKKAIETLVNEFDGSKAIDFITDSIKYTYTRENLMEAIQSQSEIIVYDVPYFFAVRQRTMPEYGKLLEMIGK